MTCIVDASVVVAAAVDTSADGRWAESVLASGALCAPEIVLVEATNILRRLEAAHRLAAASADAARLELLDLDVELFPFRLFGPRVWELRHDVTSYDAWYVALAELLDAPLATLDAKLAAAAGPRCRFLHPSL